MIKGNNDMIGDDIKHNAVEVVKTCRYMGDTKGPKCKGLGGVVATLVILE